MISSLTCQLFVIINILTLSKSGRLSDLQSVYLYRYIFATRMYGHNAFVVVLDPTVDLFDAGTANEYIRSRATTNGYTSWNT